MESRQKAKQAAGQAAAQLVEDGMCVGLGTGSTTAFAIETIGQRIQTEGLKVKGVPTSFDAARLARKYGVPLTDLDQLEGGIDLAIDGADEVDPALNLIKGRGAAHTREKVVASEASRFVVVADPSKEVKRIGESMPVPVEVVPMAVAPIMRRLKALGGQPELRLGKQKDGPVVTDQGLWVIDAAFEEIDDLQALACAIGQTPGVLEHGLFLQMASLVLVGQTDGSVRQLEQKKS